MIWLRARLWMKAIVTKFGDCKLGAAGFGLRETMTPARSILGVSIWLRYSWDR